MNIEDVPMDSITLFPVGIIINELIANAFKYAFPAGFAGVIEISMIKTGNEFEIKFRDNGTGIPGPVISGELKGFGITLINILVQQLRGSMEIQQGNGTVYIIKFRNSF